MRDSQRQKVYDAENAAFGYAQPQLTLDEAQTFIESVCTSALVRERYPRAVKPPTVKKAHGRRNGACYSPADHAIELGAGMSMKWLLLHELSHALVRRSEAKGIAPHGREYAECYLWLVRCYLGKPSADKLEAQFKAKRVVFKQKRAYTITDAERERRRARARSLRA